MMASDKHKFVLLSNPKTGTTSLEGAYKIYSAVTTTSTDGWKHMNYAKFKRVFGDYFEKRGCSIYIESGALSKQCSVGIGAVS